jgi:DNA polymerase (family 10)
MREDRGEIVEAERGELPRALRLEQVRGDLHVHTTLSGDGRSTLEEILASAAARGYEYLALTDHAENLAMSGVSRERFRLQRAQIDALRASYPGMALLHGSELNIGKDGSLDYDLAFRRTLEWCVAGVHSHFDLTRDEQTRRILAAMEDPTVDAIAHLSGRRIGRRPGIELDVDAVLRRAIDTETAIEINARSGSCHEQVLRQARNGRDLRVSTDTHHTREPSAWVGRAQATRGFVDPSHREPVAQTFLDGCRRARAFRGVSRVPAVPGRLLRQARPPLAKAPRDYGPRLQGRARGRQCSRS